MSIQLDEVFAEIKWLASRYPEIEKIVLYGSRARGDHKPHSDIDLCVFAPAEFKKDFREFAARVDNIFTHYSFDIVFFPQITNEVLKDAILTERVELC